MLHIANLTGEVEVAYGKPIDIEWAIAGDRLYLLQARPITAYLPLPPEMITPPGAPKRLYANSTLIEQGLQEPLSVLGTDFLDYVLKQVGGPIAKDAIGLGGMTFTAGGVYYMNISFALKMGMGKAALAPVVILIMYASGSCRARANFAPGVRARWSRWEFSRFRACANI